ncbi:MAG TPA: 1-acyl-sn-glycerol-3-phosphate acyltransferase, partial [Chloroflexota bacterium]
ALVALGHMPVPPVVRGKDRIPEEGRFVVVANHYERPGLWMAWPAMYVGHLIRERTGQDTHWIAIQEWESFSLWGIPIPRPVIRAVFERAFRVYGIIAMPALRAPASARAGAMRAAALRVKRGEILGLMPEGTVGATPELLDAREGAGAFLLLLTTAGTQILPVGLYEESGRLVAHFGDPFRVVPPREVARDARDSWARRHVMEAIKTLLPEPLWGVYREPAPDTSEPV